MIRTPLSHEDYVAIAQGEDPLAVLTEKFAPDIIGMDRAKQALLLCLASGQDMKGTRQRQHVLLVGPPGTGKSSLAREACHATGNTLYGPRMSTGGITVDFRTGKIGIIQDINITPYQVLGLDELEKFEETTIEHLLTSMETGSFTYAGGGHEGTVDAHVRVIATTNDDKKLSPELLDRFDYIVQIPKPNRAQAHRVVRGIVDTYLQEDEPSEVPDLVPKQGFVREYLDHLQNHQPRFPPEERRLADIVFRMLIDNEPEDEIRLRQYRGILRTAHSLARVHYSDLTAERVLESVRLLHPDWQPNQLANIEELLAFRREQRLVQGAETTENRDTEASL